VFRKGLPGPKGPGELCRDAWWPVRRLPRASMCGGEAVAPSRQTSGDHRSVYPAEAAGEVGEAVAGAKQACGQVSAPGQAVRQGSYGELPG